MAFFALHHHIGELLKRDLLVEEVSDGEFDLQRTKALAGRQVEGVARHLVAVRHPDVSRSVAATRGASHAHDALANAVVEQVDRELQWLIVVEDSRIDQIGRLSLHGAIVLIATRGKPHTAMNERPVETPGEVFQSDEAELLAYVELQPVIVGG